MINFCCCYLVIYERLLVVRSYFFFFGIFSVFEVDIFFVLWARGLRFGERRGFVGFRVLFYCFLLVKIFRMDRYCIVVYWGFIRFLRYGVFFFLGFFVFVWFVSWDG